MHVLPVWPQIEDRVPDELSGSVIGDVAAATRLLELDPEGLPTSGVREHMLRVRPGAERDHVRVLEQNELVGDLARATTRNEVLLEGDPVPIRNRPEAPDLENPTRGPKRGGLGRSRVGGHDISARRPAHYPAYASSGKSSRSCLRRAMKRAASAPSTIR